MKKVISTLALFLTFVMAISLSACSSSGNSAQKSDTGVKTGHIKSVTAITEVFGDGQKVTAAAVEYDKDIDNSKLSNSSFSVDGRTITKVCANSEAGKAAQGVNGKYVIVELSNDDKNASKTPGNMGGGPQNNSANDQGGAGTSGNSSNNQNAGGNPPSNPPSGEDGGPHFGNYTVEEPKISVKQAGDITTTNGEKCASDSNAIANTKAINLVVDDFKQLEFKDPKTGITLKYNLFIPKNYDKSKSYPMVMFIHDASVQSTDARATLVQGVGGVIWATPAEQAKHECFVLAPQFSTTTANDNYETTKDLYAAVNLIYSLEGQYSIDKNRIYTTGQSMGCMSSIALNIKYPDLFAASLLVAGQWDPTKVASMAKNNIWIIVSEGDEKAYPGMNAITAALEKEGAKVSKATWNARASEAEISSNTKKMIAEDTNIKYTVLQKGTVVPAGEEDNSISNHMSTWKVAYSFQGVRDWLFTQVKNAKQ